MSEVTITPENVINKSIYIDRDPCEVRPAAPQQSPQAEKTSKGMTDTAIIDVKTDKEGFSKDYLSPLTTDIPVGKDKLSRFINNEIQKEGYIPYSRFMELSNRFFYASVVEFNGQKDFITAPERHPSFGGICGNVMYRMWESMGSPNNFQIVELGGGRGKLASGLLDSMKLAYPDFYNAIQYISIDSSQNMLREQSKSTGSHKGKTEFIQQSALNPLDFRVEGGILHYELMDAFPLERITRNEGEYLQKYITIHNGKYVEFWAAPSPQVISHIQKHNPEVDLGAESVINLGASLLQNNLCEALSKGCIMGMDYGGMRSPEVVEGTPIRFYGNIEGYRPRPYGMGGFTTAYRNPGRIDLTADVDFRPINLVSLENGLQLHTSGDLQHVLQLYNARELEDILYKVGYGAQQNSLASKLKFDMGQYFSSISRFHTTVHTRGISSAPVLKNDYSPISKFS